MEEGLPKSGAQLQGAENGAAYACARGMAGEKKITTHAAANRTALLHLLLYDCILPLPLIYVLLAILPPPSPLPIYSHCPHHHRHHTTNILHHCHHPILSPSLP